MARQVLFRHFDDLRWAEAMVRGSLRFRSLSYYRDFEDGDVRGDLYEARLHWKPDGGVKVRNENQLVDYEFDGVIWNARAAEILVYCLSRSLAPEQFLRFKTAAYVEISDAAEFCRRVTKALPQPARLHGRPGRERLGYRVDYRELSADCNPAWALPGAIGLAKRRSYQWQNEFRLMFSTTEALEFEQITGDLYRGVPPVPPKLSHLAEEVEVEDLRDIARIRLP